MILGPDYSALSRGPDYSIIQSSAKQTFSYSSFLTHTVLKVSSIGDESAAKSGRKRPGNFQLRYCNSACAPPLINYRKKITKSA
jgi:hypothetical protein